MKFLAEMIPDEDLKIWRAALYMRHLFEQRKDIAKLKSDITEKYGEKGKNITNLCSAGYIENLLIPNYESLKEVFKEEETIRKHFSKLYSLVVYELTITVFVHFAMKEDEIKQQILDKIEQNMKYGIKFLNIHGIGKSNVKKINEIIDELEDRVKENSKEKIVKEIFKEQTKEIILLRLIF